MSNTTDDKGNTVIGGGLGGHWGPDNTHKHAGPHGDGHREIWKCYKSGKRNSRSNRDFDRIPFKAVKGKAFVIHAMPDNFTDHPVNGGSGARMYAAPFRDYNDYF